MCQEHTFGSSIHQHSDDRTRVSRDRRGTVSERGDEKACDSEQFVELVDSELCLLQDMR